MVTAVTKRGFYLQTPDNLADKDPKTSEGIYVFGAELAGSVEIGNMVQVDGTVVEYVPKGEVSYFGITEISKGTIKVLSEDTPLPVPIVLTMADLDPRGKFDQMERFEGMRVKADIIVVRPTGGYPSNKSGVSTSNGTFFATLIDAPRPFREAGVDAIKKVTEKLPATVPVFDTNPEILRVKSDEQTGHEDTGRAYGCNHKRGGHWCH